MRAKRVGRSVVSAITQTPASGPLELFTVPEMSLPAAKPDVATRKVARPRALRMGRLGDGAMPDRTKKRNGPPVRTVSKCFGAASAGGAKSPVEQPLVADLARHRG